MSEPVILRYLWPNEPCCPACKMAGRHRKRFKHASGKLWVMQCVFCGISFTTQHCAVEIGAAQVGGKSTIWPHDYQCYEIFAADLR